MSLPNSADPGRYNVRIQQFTIAYDGANPVLNIPYLELVSGSYTLITGPTGCGKSSLAHALVGVLEDMTTARVAGSISMNGTQLATLDSAQRSGTIAAVWQRPETQLFASTVLAEVRAGLDFQLIAPNEATFRARRALHHLGLSHNDESRNPLTHSGREQQRLALASA
ncbi:MAG: ATP-binding cassette domain-containing protein, partial [Yaniella sp.]|nr:ATP-binding cassette domain-containing protein [Yaniella sp.]